MEMTVPPTFQSCNSAVNVRIEIVADMKGIAIILHCSPWAPRPGRLHAGILQNSSDFSGNLQLPFQMTALQSLGSPKIVIFCVAP